MQAVPINEIVNCLMVIRLLGNNWTNKQGELRRGKRAGVKKESVPK